MRLPPAQVMLTGLLLAAAVLLRIADPEPIARLRLSVFDSYLRLAPRQADPAYPVRIVDIDEASLARIGQWPWPRTKLAAIIDRLNENGAKSITLDLILAEPDRLSPDAMAKQLAGVPELKPLADRAASLPSNDARLAEAIAAAPVVLGIAAQPAKSEPALPPPRASLAIAGDDPKLYAPSFPGGVASLPILTAKAAGQGVVNWLPSSDQIVRRVPLLVTVGGALHPSLSLETLRLSEKESTLFVKSSGGSGILSFGERTGIDSIRVGGTILPTDADGQMWLKFARADAQRFVPAWRILEGEIDAKEIAGRHILIGASATGLLDLRATPLEASVPGVEIHAQALEQMLSGDHLLRPAYATGLEILFLLATGALVAWLIGRSGPIAAALAGAAAVAAVSMGSWLSYANAGYLLDPVYPSLALMAIYLTGSLTNFVKAETERARIRSTFSHYVAPELVEELARDPGKLKLGGETREVTILFADVRGFSQLSEGMSAEDLVRFVNRLFTPVTAAILSTRGTIDKFMGDAVMAFWNAPLADPDHARNACRAALRIIEEVERLNEQRVAGAKPIRLGIGINTGPGVAGNVGSPQRLNYSVLGDTVNTAARLEEATKTYGAAIIAGEQTAAAAHGLAFLEIGTASLRGKDRPERLFALLGGESVANSERFASLKREHAALGAALKGKDMAQAARRLEAIRALGWDGLAPFIDKLATDLPAPS